MMNIRYLLSALTIISFGTAFIRDVLFAQQLGAGLESDAVWLALVIPAIFEQVIGGPIRDALIARRASRSETDGSRWFFILGPTLVIVVVLIVPLWMGQSLLADVLISGWSDEAKIFGIHILTIGLLMIPGHTVYYAQWALAASVGRFALAHSRSIWLNVAAFSTVLLFPGDPMLIIWGMIGGTVLHAIAMELLMLRGPLVEGTIPAQATPKTKTSGAPQLLAFSIAALAPQICVLLERGLASQISEGSITYLSIGFRFATIVASLTVAALIVPIYANLERIGDRNQEEFWSVLSGQLRWIFLLILPSCAVFFALSSDMTRIFLQRGEFTETDVIATASAIRGYSWGVPAFCLILVLTRSLAALRSLGSIMLASAVMLGCYLMCVYGLAMKQSIVGLSVAFSVSQLAFASVLSVLLIRKLGWATVLQGASFGFAVRLVLITGAVFVTLTLWPIRSGLGLLPGLGLAAMAGYGIYRVGALMEARSADRI